MAKLLLLLDGAVLRHVDLSKERTTIGRRRVNDVVIDNLGVSGEHAAVLRRADDYHVEDLGSTNGTLVNGEQVRSRRLQSGDSIEISKYRLKFLADGGSATDTVSGGETYPPRRHRFDHSPSTIRLRTTERAPAMAGARLVVLSGTSSGHEVPLEQGVTRIGSPGLQLAVVTRRPTGYFIGHLEGEVFSTLNGADIGSAAHPLANNDLVEVAGVIMRFVDGRYAAARTPKAP